LSAFVQRLCPRRRFAADAVPRHDKPRGRRARRVVALQTNLSRFGPNAARLGKHSHHTALGAATGRSSLLFHRA
jgi:hypothetical protein